MYVMSASHVVCPDGTYGDRCRQNCNCPGMVGSPQCSNVDGMCICLAGYTGATCEQGKSRAYSKKL